MGQPRAIPHVFAKGTAMALSETRKRFNEEFKRQRVKEGPTFEFEGKTYSKKMASDVESNPYKATSGTYKPRESRGDLKLSSSSNDEPKAAKTLSADRPGPTVARAKEMQAARDRRDALDKRDALETDTTLEETAAIAPGLLRMAGKKLFGSAKKGAEEYVKKDPSFYDDLFPKIGYDKNVTAAPSKAEMMTQQRAERAAEKYQEMLQENADRYGIDMKKVPQAGLDYIKQRVLGDGQNFRLKKKGGMIKKYAKGGSADKSPARGNGCAVRGLTKGKQY